MDKQQKNYAIRIVSEALIAEYGWRLSLPIGAISRIAVYALFGTEEVEEKGIEEKGTEEKGTEEKEINDQSY